MRKRGDILEATDRSFHAGKHYIVFYDGYNDDNFIGAMLTHTVNDKNELMNASHFIEDDEKGNEFKVRFENTHLVKAKLMKFEKWGPFNKVGELTNSGIDFVENTIDHLQTETWDEYKNRTK
ncbi:MAG TPA: hypothetical protein VF868_00030 [Bacteroidia bacterium]|jgi:hypothetical protein